METASGHSWYPSANGACQYQHHEDEIATDAREATTEGVPRSLDADSAGYWHCPHPRLDDSDYCVFHADTGPDNPDVLGDIVHTVLEHASTLDSRRERRRRLQFIGASIEGIRLDEARLEAWSNFAIDFRSATIGRFDVRSADITVPLDLRRADITEFRGANASLTRLYGQALTAERLLAAGATLTRAYFESADIGRVRLYQAASEYLDFGEASVRFGNFLYADFEEAGFMGTTFELATFFRTDFESGYLNRLEAEYLNLGFARGWELHLKDCDCRAITLMGASFDDGKFDRATVERLHVTRASFDLLRLDNAHLGVARIRDCTIGRASFESSSFDGALELRDSDVDELSLSVSDVGASDIGYLDCRDSAIGSGELSGPADGRLIYDFTRATLGPVQFVDPDDGLVLDILFSETTYEGFDFEQQTGDRQVLELERYGFDIHRLRPGTAEQIAVRRELQIAAGEIHSALEDRDEDRLGATSEGNAVDFGAVQTDVAPDGTATAAFTRAQSRTAVPDRLACHEPGDDTVPPSARLKKTYLEAKNGAKAAGNAFATGRFFEKEHRYRRRIYWEEIFQGDGIGVLPLSRWVRSGLLSLTSGYGERPWRVVASSLAIVVLFAPLYVIGFETDATSVSGLIEVLLFSFQSFITFLIGNPPNAPNIFVRIAGAAQGFLGAFFIALFVFTLTRRIHR